MKKQYIARFSDLIIHTDNWEHGEDPKSGCFINPDIKTTYFDTIDDLREIIANEFTFNVDAESINISDNGFNMLLAMWQSSSTDGTNDVDENDLASFKQGEIDLYNCYLDIEIFKVKAIDCVKEFSDDLD
jgi:hypothetical protein